jgi:Pentapeptide repeats (8 copies)
MRLSEYCCLEEDIGERFLKRLVGFTAFCYPEEAGLCCISNIVGSLPCQNAMNMHRALFVAKKSAAKPNTDAEKFPLERIRETAAILNDTRDALAEGLRLLAKPKNLPDVMNNQAFEKWRRDPPLELFGCFLAGASLHGAQFQGADLRYATLVGADFVAGPLGNFDPAKLQGADLSGAMLQHANLITAGLQRTKLYQAQLEKASLFNVRLDGAMLLDARFISADFGGANWWDADEDSWMDGRMEQELKWLNKKFPRPA